MDVPTGPREGRHPKIAGFEHLFASMTYASTAKQPFGQLHAGKGQPSRTTTSVDDEQTSFGAYGLHEGAAPSSGWLDGGSAGGELVVASCELGEDGRGPSLSSHAATASTSAKDNIHLMPASPFLFIRSALDECRDVRPRS